MVNRTLMRIAQARWAAECLHKNRWGDLKTQHYPGWLYILAPTKAPYSNIGKYLFFSDDREALISIAQTEIRQHAFHVAKVSDVPVNGYALCLYYRDDSRKWELADRAHEKYRFQSKSQGQPGPFRGRYRYWKLDADTIAGKYSVAFRQELETAVRRSSTHTHR